jgi:hypothetical protein
MNPYRRYRSFQSICVYLSIRISLSDLDRKHELTF